MNKHGKMVHPLPPPAGDKRYASLGRDIGEMVEAKNAAYGDSFNRSGAVLREIYPAGVRPGQMDDALCVTRIVDKLFRIAADNDPSGETPYRDIAGYALLGARRAEVGKLQGR